MNEREGHQEQIIRWANFVRDNPSAWKKPHTEFINALFQKQEEFRERLLQTPGGEAKWQRLIDARNGPKH